MTLQKEICTNTYLQHNMYLHVHRLLPEMSKPETSVKVNIRHSDHVHRGPCQMPLTPAIKVSDEDQCCEVS